MGGWGSGWRWFSVRPTTDQYAQVAIYGLARYLRPGEPSIPLWGGGKTRMVVDLEWTPCNFGGMRPWFRCPGCGRRCAVLYWTGGRFLCRCCLGLAYPSQRESPAERAKRRAAKIRKRLGGDPWIHAPLPEKPPRMHWSTYWRLVERAFAAQETWYAAMHGHLMAMLGRMERARSKLGE